MNLHLTTLAVIILWLIAILRNSQCLKVSFYGGSHIAMPIQEAKISTNIRLRFRTYQENSLIMLAAGRTDYALLSLDGGRIKFQFKIDDYQTELWSPNKHRLNDLQWHDVAVQRYETNITIQCDEHIIRKAIPVRIGELNIHFGVFLGGVGDFSERYITSIDGFRGCISDVFYNNVNVFKRAKERTSHVESVQVTWTCSAEFDANERQSISFIDDEAYIMLAKPPVHSGESWYLEMRTIESLATVLYNSGSDFVSLELVDSRLRLLVGKGSNAVELIAERNVSDGKWHNVTINYSPSKVELIVDDKRNSASFANGSSSIIELDEEYYIGGFTSHKKKRAASKGLRAIDESFRGCIRNIRIDTQLIGFLHMKLTQGVAADCVWSYPCLDKSPCISSATCEQYGVDEFICYCDQAYCIKANYTERYKIFTRSDLPMEIEMLAIQPIQVIEGDGAFLSTRIIDVLIDYTKLGIMEAGVIFNIVQQPKHGRLSIIPFGGEDSPNATQGKFFSLIDLSTDKVKYTHNGLEQFSDHMTMDMQLVANNRENLPDFLSERHRFVLHANITPVNDGPVLNLPTNRILRLTQGIPKLLTSDLLLAADPDSPPNALIYSILSAPHLVGVGPNGKIEVNGKHTTTFSQEDINQGLVNYFVNSQSLEDTNFELAIQVSDGMETSSTVYLPVSVQPLQLRMVNNTGLILIHKSFAIISPWNLSFVSNSDDDKIDVLYEIVQPTQFGNIQKLRTVDSSWITVDSFTNNQILLGHIRYVHNTDFPVHDECKFTASFGPVKTIKYDFRLTFTKLQIGIQTQNSLQINGTRETIITPDFLNHQTTPITTFPRNIIYTVIVPPKYGFIYVDGHPEHAMIQDSFTQSDIDKNLIRYKTLQSCYSSFVDVLEFMVSVTECDEVMGLIKIIYNPPEKLARSLTYQTREKIFVKEGDRSLVTRRNFQVLFNRFNTLNFELSVPPKHGHLCNIDSTVDGPKLFYIKVFSLKNLFLDDIYYCHDDSESVQDSMHLLVLSDMETDFQFVCEVLIDITLINDNGPYRIVDRIFNVVLNDTKTIKSTDLAYLDPDVNTSDTDIIYALSSDGNAEYYRNGGQTTIFTQDDINHDRIMVRHIGDDYGQTSFIVSDGTYEIPGVLKIQASEPFIKISERNASIVQENKYIMIRKYDVAIETNLNSKPDEIVYRIISGPDYGVLKILRRKFNGTMLPRTGNITSIKNFTQWDIERKRLIYWNTDVASMDRIRYRVTSKGISAEGEILIRIYPAAYWDLLQIRRNQTLYVEESTGIKISRDILEVVHPNISPGDITYLVTTPPQHGYLEVQSITSADEYNCKVFDQSTINSEKMFYIQAGVNQSLDHFIFDVTNGITWLHGLLMKIVIIPGNLYIRTKNITVEEGKEVLLKAEDMIPYSDYYNGKILEYKIIQQPSFGYVRSDSSKINRFTHKQLETGHIQYVHDDSENLLDIIRFVAIARNKESVPFDLIILILPINDEIPLIVTNTGLQMWIGGRSLIRRTDLTAQDYDTPPEYLTFIITQVIGGWINHKSDPYHEIQNFTQHQINTEQIYFTHDSNHLNGQFRFIITDGDHASTEHTLHVVTKPVALEMIKNDNLHVFPLTRKQILPDQLHYRCSDTDRDVKFVVTIAPQTGRILFEYPNNGTSLEVNEFTQQDINMGRIIYEHTHTMIELKSNDSFYFDVTAKLANSLIDQIFHIEISVSSGGLLRFLPVPRFQLNEGESSPIKLDLSKVLEYLETRADISNPALYIDVYPPNNGVIEMDEVNRNISRFPLQDFIDERVVYRHDHSDTTADKIQISVYLQQPQLFIFLCNLTIPVIVKPVNDQPFFLTTQSPHMTIVEGENRTITDNELLVEDADTDPYHLIYDIISPPTLGTLVKIGEDGVAHNVLAYGNQFSQGDINEGRIQYIHSGPIQATTFYFKVSDGRFTPATEIFNLRIVPVTVGQGLDPDMVTVKQGSNTALMESKHLPVETNAHKSRIMYNVTESPNSGVLMLDNTPTLRFGQLDVDAHRIVYMQNNQNRSSDDFKVFAHIIDTNHGITISIKVTVDPFIKINGISILSSDTIHVTYTFDADSTQNQMKLNRFNPKFLITRRPEHGEIRKIIRNTATESDPNNHPTNSKDISTFTYKELQSGVVYFVARLLPDEVQSIDDYFEYVMLMKTVQPGQGYVAIVIHRLTEDLNRGLNDLDPNNVGSDVNVVAYADLPAVYLILMSLAALIAIILVIIYLVIRCRANSSLKDKNYPPPLPRPPDFLPINNRLYAGSDMGDESIPVTASSTPLPALSSIPHCKVFPILDLDDQSETDADDILNRDMTWPTIQYPYGTLGQGQDGGDLNGMDDNDEMSSSCDVGNEVNYSSIAQPQQQQLMNQRNNPLLRRNQYWV